MYTPRLELDIGKIEEQFTRFRGALPQFEVYYSVKTNDDPLVLKRLQELGSKFEIVSPSDLEAVLRVDVPPSAIIHSNPVPHPDYVQRMHQGGISVFFTQSKGTIDTIARFAPGSKLVLRVSMPETNELATVNLDKFGADITEVPELLRYAEAKQLQPYGLAFHVGGQNTRIGSWTYALQKVLPVADKYGLPFVDISGGFPISFRGDEPTIEEIGAIITPLVEPYKSKMQFATEPGRYIVSDAGTLVYTILDVHQRGDKRYAYIDGSIFGSLAIYPCHPFPVSIDGKDTQETEKRHYVLTTNTCDGRDIVSPEIELPANLAPGDILRFHKAGAYTLPFVNVEYAGLKSHKVIYK